MLKPIKVNLPESPDKETTILCTHARAWPPPLMLLDVNIEQMHRNGEIQQHDYQQIQTWEKVCGLLKMAAEKCIDCPLAKVQRFRAGSGRKEIEPLPDVRKRLGAQALKEKPVVHAPPSKKEIAEKMIDKGILDSEPDPPSTEPDKKPLDDLNAEPEAAKRRSSKKPQRKRTKETVNIADATMPEDIEEPVESEETVPIPLGDATDA